MGVQAANGLIVAITRQLACQHVGPIESLRKI
jgi:hypothetical protein